MTKRKIAALILAPIAVLLLSAQTFGPQVFSPFLTIGNGTRATSGLRVNGNVTVTGTCTGCVDSTDFAKLSQSNDFTGATQGINNANPKFALRSAGGTAQARLEVSAGDTFLVSDVSNAGLNLQTTGASSAIFLGNSVGAVAARTLTGSLQNRGTANNTTTNNSFVSFQQLGGTENGHVGFANGDAILRVSNSISGAGTNVNSTNGPVQVNAGTSTIALSGSGGVSANGSLVCTANGTNCPLTESSGQFQTLETTGCSNSHSLLFAYRKIGTIVFLQIKAGGDCTSDGSGFVQYANTNWPAALLPLTTLRMAVPWSTCGGTVQQAVFQIGTTGSPLMDFRATCAAASTLQFNGNLSMVVSYSTAFPSSPG